MVRLGIVRGVSYGLFGPTHTFLPQVRALGAGLARVYVYWSQVQPRPGEWVWGVVDAVLDQCHDGDELWVTVCSSSPWATRTATDFLPPSPALDDGAYATFVDALVRRCAGRVRYWQCDNEPSNAGLLWAGSAAEYVHQLRLFAGAVRGADPGAEVVLGGLGHDVLSAPAGAPPWEFFDEVVRDGRDHFDVCDVHLYDDPYRIPDHLTAVRTLLRAHGADRPVVVGEYSGPTLFEFPGATAALEAAMAAAFTGDAPGMSTAELAAQVAAETPDRRAVRSLYARSGELPRELRMFLHDAPEDLVAVRERAGCRQLVQRAVLAAAADVRTVVCWNLAPEVGGWSDPFNVMDLLFGTCALMGWADGEIAVEGPRVHTHRLLAAALAGAEQVTPLDVVAPLCGWRLAPDRIVLWRRTADALDETAEPVAVRRPWPHPQAHGVDAYGAARRLPVDDGHVVLDVGAAPVFVTAAPLVAADRSGQERGRLRSGGAGRSS